MFRLQSIYSELIMTLCYFVILGAWTERERLRETSNFPKLAIDYPPSMLGETISNISGQAAAQITPDPNICVWGGVLSIDKIEAIEADPNYWIEYAEVIE